MTRIQASGDIVEADKSIVMATIDGVVQGNGFGSYFAI